ncbi:MAG: Uncharacterised protein [Methanobacteriota archaeon]|nr:MAG: Uncharacterised protein [Euryarchaeota archaeon]
MILPPAFVHAAAVERAVPPPPTIPNTDEVSWPNASATIKTPAPSVDAAHQDWPSHRNELMLLVIIQSSTALTAAAESWCFSGDVMESQTSSTPFGIKT